MTSHSDLPMPQRIFLLFRWYLRACAAILGTASLYIILSTQVIPLKVGILSAFIFSLACVALAFSFWFGPAGRVNNILARVILEKFFIVFYLLLAGVPLLFYLLLQISQPAYLFVVGHFSKIYPLIIAYLAWIFFTTLFLIVYSFEKNYSDLGGPKITLIHFRLFLWATSLILDITSISYILLHRYSVLKQGIYSISIFSLALIFLVLSLRFKDAERLNKFLHFVLRKKNLLVFFISLAGVLLLFFLLVFIFRPFFLLAIKIIPSTLPLLCACLVWLFAATIFLGVYLRENNAALFQGYQNDYLAIILILLQHFLIFKDHYLNDYGFPWDFNLDYYGFTVSWTSLATKGIIPNWFPFTQMGYPLAMNLQSGIHYPLFWLFPLLKISYTLHAAVVFQALHILLGAIGMYIFLKAMGNKPVYACIGAVAFQFFGGFYSNSEHADIIRAFSIIPWLLYSFTLNRRTPTIPRRILLIPLLIFLLATGGYPGNFISGLVVLGVYSLIQLVLLAVSSKSWRTVWSPGIWIFSLTCLGVAMALFHLGTAFAEKGYLFRYVSIGKLADIKGLEIQQLPSLFFTNQAVPGEVSMTSMFITLPVLILAFFISWKYLKKASAILAVGLFGVLMAGGPNSILWKLLAKTFTPLAFSRFPISDYREFFAIALIFMALGGLRAIFERREQLIRTILRTGIIVIVFIIGLYSTLLFIPNKFEPLTHALKATQALQSLIIFVLMLGAIWLFTRKKGISPNLLSALTGVLIFINGMQVLPSLVEWRTPNISNIYSAYVGYQFYDGSGNFKPELIYENMPDIRPERKFENNPFYTVLGYVSGKFYINDLFPDLLAGAHLINYKALYSHYMSLSWTPLLLPAELIKGKAAITIPDEIVRAAVNDPAPVSTIRQDSYGMDEIRYQIKLAAPALLVENEIYFPGWQAVLIDGEGQKVVQAIPVNQVFRGWALPAGQYQMIAQFSFPNQTMYILISLLAVILWGMLSLGRLGVFHKSLKRRVKTD
jgi:hypothetical protein